jgi:hypothetical protein
MLYIYRVDSERALFILYMSNDELGENVTARSLKFSAAEQPKIFSLYVLVSSSGHV